MKKLLIFLLIPLLNFTQEIRYSQPDYYDVPLAQNHKNVIDIFTWYDNLGKNTLILTAKKSSGVKVDLRAYHYTGDGNLLWDIKDYAAKDENGKLGGGINHKKVRITDLDDDGVAEISILYNLGWDDEAVEAVKLIMHEDGKKYAIRGKIWWLNGDECRYNYNMFGKNSFESAKPVFDRYAQDLFLKEMKSDGEWCDHINDY